MTEPTSVVLGEDDVLLREGIARLLVEAGFDVVAQTGDATDFLRRALAHRPDVAVVDVQMPPEHEDDGLRAALELRRQRPDTGVLVLSQFYEDHYARELIGERAEGVGYLLKERVGDVDAFIDAVNRVAGGGTALDPEVVARMLGRRRGDHPLDRLSPRERDVLIAMAEGKSNRGIAESLFVTQAAVEKHVTSIFEKLELEPAAGDHRRVLAVLTYPTGRELTSPAAAASRGPRFHRRGDSGPAALRRARRGGPRGPAGHRRHRAVPRRCRHPAPRPGARRGRSWL